MSLKQPTRLGPTAETLLIPLFARAMENRRKMPILADPKAAEMVEGIDWDFQQFNQRLRVVACNLRSARYDEWVAEFVRRNPHGTVVEIGAGLNLICGSSGSTTAQCIGSTSVYPT
jgi:O-methyltransferase involved in polyketide biosynthesis